MKLRPSEYRLFIPDGAVPLWEVMVRKGRHWAADILVWVKVGIRGDHSPASAASGMVPCKWAEDSVKYPLDLTGGCPEDGWVEVDWPGDVGESSRRMLSVVSPDGPLEVKEVLVVDELRLGDA